MFKSLISCDITSSRFSRVVAEFTALALPARVHEALIRTQLGDQIIGHIAQMRPRSRCGRSPPPRWRGRSRRPSRTVRRGDDQGDAGIRRAGTGTGQAARAPAQRGGTAKEPTVIEQQVDQRVAESLAQLPTACDVGSKKNSKGFKETWTGYKLPIDTADGDIPVTALLTSASLHDSQAAIPLMRVTGERVTYLYDLADSAYRRGVIREVSRQEGHVPLIDHNARRGEKIEFAPHEAQRYKARSQAERVNSLC